MTDSHSKILQPQQIEVATSLASQSLSSQTLKRSEFGDIECAGELVASGKLTVPPEIVHGLLHARTKGVLAASSKIGKTWFLLDLAVSVASGTKFVRWPTTKGKVLFVNFELDRAFISQRLRLVARSKSVVDLDDLDIWNLRGQVSKISQFFDELLDRVREQHYALIILDPIYKLLVGRSENMSTGVSLLCQQIERLVEQAGAAVVYSHHFCKGDAGKKKPLDRMSGSGVFARDADTIRDKFDAVLEVAAALEQIRDKKLFRLKGHKSFEAYCREELGFDRKQASRLIQAHRLEQELSPVGDKSGLTNEHQSRLVRKIKNGQGRIAAVARAKARSGDESMDPKILAEEVEVEKRKENPAQTDKAEKTIERATSKSFEEAKSSSGDASIGETTAQAKDESWLLNILQMADQLYERLDDGTAGAKDNLELLNRIILELRSHVGGE